jgi:glycosyltransferase involved in cell wall biosynthesis
MVRDGVNGYLCAVDDSDGLAARVTEVLTRSEDSWRAMSDAAYATVASYTWDDATDRFENALERAVASGMRDAGVAVRRPVHTPQHGVA